ncbi:DivIVA domain-containing protein [Verrucosispora sp. WMMD573]|uniref:DivIVA domain-containing protein n=1 Tax=Verrucosispora sp. WMMD573 TaxID=3015149 RepID=UPI00248CD67B|nr:DivIVA domain-containing protein [Verrucosispora sp. WMMD573]WBB54413.1 DivIVA domain-containing protein [Verrucosispora sp. WMMD573]
MRIPFRRRRHDPGHRGRPEPSHAARPGNQRDERHETGTCYRAATYRPLRPWQVRDRRFRLGRRGYDPVEVVAFLDRVAGDLEAAYRQVAAADRESARVREALRRWQSEQAQARQARLNQPSVGQADPHQRPANQGRHR